MTSEAKYAHPLPQVRNQYLILEEADREGSHQTKLTESESSGLSNPPTNNTLADGKHNTFDQTTISLNSGVMY